MQTAQTEYKKKFGTTVKSLAERVWKREDNPFKKEYIMKILKLYHEEIYKALLDGEKINLSKIGTLTPKLHAPISNNLYPDDEDKCQPYVSIDYVQNRKLKNAASDRFRRNIQDGFDGLSEHCICTTQQRNTLIRKGFLEGEEVEDEDYGD